jgi:hypothetical protein
VDRIPLSYYVPGHLPKRIDEYSKRFKNLAVTFIQFSPNGNELLVNLGGEQLYSFVLNEDYSRQGQFSLKHDAFREMLANAPTPACGEETSAEKFAEQQKDTSNSTSKSTSSVSTK